MEPSPHHIEALKKIHLHQVSVPECQDLLSPVFALLEARTQHYSQVLVVPLRMTSF